MAGLDDVFDNLTEEAPAEVVEQQEVIETQQEPEAEPVVEVPEAPQEPEEKSVPLATFLDMRDKQKEAERRASDYERQLSEARAAQQQKPQAPDPYDQPEAYAAYQNQQVQEAVMGQKFETSDLIARQSHGDEAVEAATAWAMEKVRSNPGFAAEYMKERHPIDWLVKQHKQDADLTDYRTDPVAFARRILETNGQQIAPTPSLVVAPQPTVTAPKAPPRSLVNAPSHGGVSETPVGKLAGFDTVFPG